MPRTVLVIEDDGPIAEMLVLLLGDAGYTVSVASTESEALEQARTLEPDLITLDLALPGVSGTSLLRALRADGNDAPVVVISANPDELAPTDRALAAAVIRKPFDVDEMLASVAHVLD